MATVVTTLRDFLRYAVSCNLCSIVPDAIKAPRQFSMETFPSSPSWDEVERIVGYYGISDVRGMRNTAIMALMAVYGLRSSEVQTFACAISTGIKDAYIYVEQREVACRRSH